MTIDQNLIAPAGDHLEVMDAQSKTFSKED